mmetsp:Transcript_9703/g.30097  ORF Transcript_9703/g.30097 Transcript_9703/m.30097 type:complete len:249 (-) Transcript_9703:596-1342(-)
MLFQRGDICPNELVAPPTLRIATINWVLNLPILPQGRGPGRGVVRCRGTFSHNSMCGGRAGRRLLGLVFGAVPDNQQVVATRRTGHITLTRSCGYCCCCWRCCRPCRRCYWHAVFVGPSVAASCSWAADVRGAGLRCMRLPGRGLGGILGSHLLHTTPASRCGCWWCRPQHKRSWLPGCRTGSLGGAAPGRSRGGSGCLQLIARGGGCDSEVLPSRGCRGDQLPGRLAQAHGGRERLAGPLHSAHERA